MKRRDFFQQAAIVSTGMLAPVFLTKCNQQATPLKNNNSRKLVVIQLSGGNDGLNSFVPYENDFYYRLRPTIALPANKVIKIDDSIGLNPALRPLAEMFNQDILTVINAVGYPNASRSHFKSSDIWHAAQMDSKKMNTGWLGRYLDSECQTELCALETSDTPALALTGRNKKGFCVSSPEELLGAFDNGFLSNGIKRSQSIVTDNSAVDFLYKELISTKQNVASIVRNMKTANSTTVYPDTKFAQDLSLIAKVMTAQPQTKVYYSSLTGFDTHVRQAKKHTGLLQDLSQSLAAFIKDLKAHQLLDDTLIMVFSEFGRRTQENANKGTDHGKANNLLLINPKLKQKGFIGDIDLTDMDEGDLRYQTDFRSVYSTILNQWLGTPSAGKILGDKFPELPLF